MVKASIPVLAVFFPLLGLSVLPLAAAGQDTATTKPSATATLQVVFTPDYALTSADSDTVYYDPQHPLLWEDFKGHPRPWSKNGAVSYTSFGYEGSAKKEGTSWTVQLTVQVFFVKSASWVSADSRNAHALEHERLHFSIAQLGSILFKKKVLTASLSPENYNSEIQYLYLEAFREMNQLQEAYDRETGHGWNPAAEARWRNYVNEALNTASQ